MSKIQAIARRNMRRLCLAWMLWIVISSCNKDNSAGGSANPSSALLSSVRFYTHNNQIIDSFSYDSAHRIARFAQYGYDSSAGYAVQDSIITTFSFLSNQGLPDSYSYINGPGLPLRHQLFFDAQNRIIKDTSVSGTGFVTYYTYPGNAIISRVLFKGGNNPGDYQIDTMLMANGNIQNEHIYYPNLAGTADSLSANLFHGYSPYLNPAYQSGISSSIGPLLFILTYDGYGNFTDFISRNLINSLTGMGRGLPPGGVDYSITTDASGRIIESQYALGAPYAGIIRFTYY